MQKMFEEENFLEKSLQLTGKKYGLLIIDSLLKNKGKRRFNQILKDIPSINPRILSIRLKELEENKMITKNLEFGTPIKTIYHLSEDAEGLAPAIDALKEWARKH